MAWRDSRSSLRRLAFLSLSIVFGIAALVALEGARRNVQATLRKEAKTLLGADLAVFSRQPYPEAAEERLRTVGTAWASEVMFSSMAQLPEHGVTKLVQVRALTGDFPFYGEFETVPVGARAALDEGRFALLEETVMLQHGLAVGDPIQLGQLTFTIAGAVRRVPGDAAVMSMLAPRVYIPMQALEETGLLQPGSFARYRYYLELPPEADPEQVGRQLRGEFSELRLGFDTVEERRRELGYAAGKVESYLGLIGFAALVLGAIGVASAIHVHTRQKVETIAVLRCLGATVVQSSAVFLIQALAVGLAGSLAGAALGLGLQRLVPILLSEWLPVEVAFAVSWSALGRALGLGAAAAVGAALLPILGLRRISPAQALRGQVEPAASSDRGVRFLVVLVLAGGLLGLAVQQSGGWGAVFLGGLALAMAVLATLGWGVMRLARRWASPAWSFVWRQGLANLFRPNNRTELLLVSLGLSVFLIMTVHWLRAALVAELRGPGEAATADLAFIDVQQDEVEAAAALLVEQGADAVERVPIVTMRLAEINGRTAEELMRSPDDSIPGWTLRREYRSTYRSELTETERLVAGAWRGRVGPGVEPVPVSVEEGIAEDLNLQVGDEITFDVQGLPLRSTVASIRQVEWQRLRPNFFMIFPEGVLEEAPQFYVLLARAGGADRSAQLQRALSAEFPTVSAIDLAQLLQSIDLVLRRIASAVAVMSLFVAATGMVVVAAALGAARFQRLRESILLRVLGASGSQVRGILLAEFVLLGLFATVAGALLATAAQAALAHFLLGIAPTRPGAGDFLIALVCVLVVAVGIGLLANRGILRRPPLEVLRKEI